MTDQTAIPDRDRPKIEQAITDHNPVQQVCHWIVAHKLEGYRGCNEFRVEELGLAHLIASPHSDRLRRQGKADRSGPWFVNAGIWRS